MQITRKLYGYCDRFDYRPGAVIDVMIHSEHPEVRVDVVRLRSADERVASISPREVPIPEIASVVVRGRPQKTYPGSYVEVTGVDELKNPVSVSLGAWIYPTLLAAGHDQGVISWLAGGTGVAVVLAADDRLELRVGSGSAWEVVARGQEPLLPRIWARIDCRVSVAESVAELVYAPFKRFPRGLGSGSTRAAIRPGLSIGSPEARLLIAAIDTDMDVDGRPNANSVFNGKIEAPRIAASLVPGPKEELVAAWDFAQEMAGVRVVDESPHVHHGRLVNAPTRAVTGHRWRGDEVDWRLAPEQYAAIHFHEDDLEDAGWPPSLSLELPEDLPSGVYAVRVVADDSEDRIPFIVLPPVTAARPRIAFLASTWTYQAYANACLIRRIDYRGLGISQRDYQFGPRDDQIGATEALACSLYDLYRDGSGRCYSTLRRPVFTFRPDYRSCVQGAPRHLGADLYITGWLEITGRDFDVVSDHLLDAEGGAALEGYDVVITSSHPEYASAKMLGALESFLDRGGSLMYLGGNGFYWITSQDPARPYLIECRRGNSGTRTWDSPPGETHHSTTGESGGQWRYRGRAPHALVGIGMASQGWDFKAPGFTRTPESFDPSVNWVFKGIDGDGVIGDAGLVMDGASGDELDRFDPALGSPPHGVVLATSLPHSKYYKLVVEDVLMTTDHLGGDENNKVRSDITLIETGAGGGVFSVGSITWAGAMAFNEFDNDVARMTDNVLRRFLELSEERGRGDAPAMVQPAS